MTDEHERIFSKIKNNNFNITLRFKVADPMYMEDMESVGDFIRKYFNAFYSELNIFGEYYTVQEHTNRAKFIEFCEQKTADLSRFYLILKSFMVYEHIKLYVKPKLEYFMFHKNILNIADYLSVLFNNMKTCFVVESDINMALQSMFKNNICLKDEEICVSEKYTEIERYMKILVLKENIDRKYIKIEIKNGLLHLDSRHIETKLRLSGTIENPYWILNKVETGCNKINEAIMQTFDNLNYSLIDKLVKFMVFFENRAVAKNIFTKLKDTTGNFTNFYGKYKEDILHGLIDSKGIFRLYKGSENVELSEFDYKELL